jgi:hypothetical protein
VATELVELVVVAGQPGKGCKKRTPSQDLAGPLRTPAKMEKDGGTIFKKKKPTINLQRRKGVGSNCQKERRKKAEGGACQAS